MIFKKKYNIVSHNGNTEQYVVLAFSTLLAVLLVVSALSFIGARHVQQQYNSLVSDALTKLQLISSLHDNEDMVETAVLRHLSTGDPKLKARSEEQIQAGYARHITYTNQLSKLLQNDGRRIILNEFIKERQAYHEYVQRLLERSRSSMQPKAELLNKHTLAPASYTHQRLLLQLSDSIRQTTRENGDDVFSTITTTVRNYNLLLVLAMVLTVASGVIIRRIFMQLRRDNQVLNAEIKERLKLELDLSESQRQYKMLFDNNPLPMWLFDQHSLRFLEVNEAAEKEYGFTRDEFLASSILEICPPADKERLLKRLGSSGKHDSIGGNWQHMRKDGSTFTVETRSEALPEIGEYHPRVVVTVNIEDRVQAMQMVQKSEQQLREVSSSLPGAVFQFQMDASYKYSFPFVSEGIRDLYKVTPAEVYADPTVLHKYIHPDDLKMIRKATQVSYHSLKPLVTEFRLRQPGQQKWTWVRGHGLPTLKQDSIITWNGTMIDITSQKEAQEQLIKSEANLRALLNSSPQAIYLLDKDLNLLLYNAVAENDVKTYLLKQLRIGQSILEYVDPSFAETLVENHAKAMQGNPMIYESGHGGYWYEVAYRPVHGPDNEVLAVSLSTLNISEQKQALETIKRSESQLARAQQLAHLGNWEYEIITDQLTWSDSVYDIYGVRKYEFRPTLQNTLLRIPQEERSMVLECYKRAAREQDIISIEHRILMPDGSERMVVEIGEIEFDEHGKPVRATGSVQDITKRKQNEREVLEAKNLLQSTLENIPEVIFSADQHFTITYVSPQCQELTGYSEEDFLADPTLWVQSIYEEDRHILKEQVLPALRAGKRQQFELRVVHRNQEQKWIQFRLSPMVNEDGLIYRIDGSASDITQYKMAEAKRAELTEQLLKQNQNLQQFAYIVSHNLRAPIANILGLGSIYDKERPEAPMNQRVIENLVKSARLLDSTIRDLNDILTIRSELGKVQEEVCFTTVLHHIMESLSGEVDASTVSLEHDFEDAPSVVTVRSYVHSIMLNLVTNALKYRSPDRKLRLQLRTYSVPNYICLSVSDNGLGIDLNKEKDKVFGLYKRFHPKTEGKGLGLHLVKTQAELLGGRVEIESQVNVGTTFSIYFKEKV
ncbi:PAS domain S-box protein [Pontibacter ruber]|uniref:histidine kinase n=1 Tax=Pontibacter ruber TaxID=1343895 RepID=A0ABW5CTX4_9BACT|nr:PAS domain S-box protein [Pontibacter ruber]